jgi:flagellar motor component MotA
MRASATLWLWSLKDFAIIVVGALFSAMVLATTKILIPAVITAVYAFLSIRNDETTILDFIKYAVRYFISTQQYYEWRLKDEKQ